LDVGPLVPPDRSQVLRSGSRKQIKTSYASVGAAIPRRIYIGIRGLESSISFLKSISFLTICEHPHPFFLFSVLLTRNASVAWVLQNQIVELWSKPILRYGKALKTQRKHFNWSHIKHCASSNIVPSCFNTDNTAPIEVLSILLVKLRLILLWCWGHGNGNFSFVFLSQGKS
jgi:hypothetical protein